MAFSADVNAHTAAFAASHALASAVQAGIDAVDPVDAVAATLTTDLTGANNDLVFTADVEGVGGNLISVTYVDPGEETAEESVAVNFSLGRTHIVVTLRSVSTTLSTATQVAAAVNGDAIAGDIVTVTNAPANNGSGVVTVLVQSYLSGGVDEVPPAAVVAAAAHMRVSDVLAAANADSLSLPQVFQVVSHLDGPAYKEFYDSVVAFLEAQGPAGFLT